MPTQEEIDALLQHAAASAELRNNTGGARNREALLREQREAQEKLEKESE